MKWACLACSGLLLVVACTAPSPHAPVPQASPVQPTPRSQATPVQVIQAGEPRTSGIPTPAGKPAVAASPVAAALPLSILVGHSAADVRVALDLVLREQVFLGAMAADAAASARLDELAGATDALDQSSVMLAEVVGSVKGQSAAQTLLDAWRGMTSDLVLYAQGHQASARADLEHRAPALADALAVDDFTEPMANVLLESRLQASLSLADSIVGHDASQTGPRLLAAAAANDGLARDLSTAIAARAFGQGAPPTQGADVDLRLGLARGLQAHAYLTGAALDAAADGRSADLQAFQNAADANAADLGGQVGSVYGSGPGDGLTDRLRAETAALVSAASGGDRREAAGAMDRLRGELDRLLSGANQLLPPGLLGQELRASDQALLTAADAFQSHAWGTAYARLRESARQTQRAADSLALSIVDRHPGRFLVLPTPVAAH